MLRECTTGITVGGRVHWLVPSEQFLRKKLWQGTGSLTQWVREANVTYFTEYA